MNLAITFRTHKDLGDRSIDAEFPIEITTEKDLNESLIELTKRIKEHYLPLIRDVIEYDNSKPDFKLTDEIVIKIVK